MQHEQGHEHPAIARIRARPPRPADGSLALDDLREIALAAGADDAGVVAIDRAEIADQRAEIERALPGARTLISICVRMNRDAIRSPERSVANVEFHHTSDETVEVGRRIVAQLADRGWRALVPAAGFPMEMDRFPGRIWVVSHKPVAVAAGLGRMGLHRNVIHPRFGSFVLLDTVITDAVVEGESRPIADENPCVSCKLCVAACPVGAIAPDGRFDVSACYSHNYREFMGGFTDWVERVADSKDARAYRRRVSDAESASVWQSLSFGANYKAAYCLAVCPAGEDVLGPFVTDRKAFLHSVVDPLRAKVEPVYVLRGSDAADHVARRFPHKLVRDAGQAMRSTSVAGFLAALPLVFQRGKAGDLALRVRFTFTGHEAIDATVAIASGAIAVVRGAPAEDAPPADVHVTVDAQTWLGLVRRERSLLWAVLSRRLRIAGPARHLRAFQRCFPG